MTFVDGAKMTETPAQQRRVVFITAREENIFTADDTLTLCSTASLRVGVF